MQYCDCSVSLHGSDNYIVVEKTDLSIPEIVLMQHLHGEDAVRNIRPVRTTKEPVISAKRRLLERYSDPSYGAIREAVEKLWPGMNPMLPRSLEDIGLVENRDDGNVTDKGPAVVRAADLAAGLNIEDDGDELDDGSSYAAEDAARAEVAEADAEVATDSVMAAAAARGAALARSVGKRASR